MDLMGCIGGEIGGLRFYALRYGKGIGKRREEKTQVLGTGFERMMSWMVIRR